MKSVFFFDANTVSIASPSCLFSSNGPKDTALKLQNYIT